MQSLSSGLRTGYNFLRAKTEATSVPTANITNKVSSGLSSASAGIQRGLSLTMVRTLTSVVDKGKQKVAAIIEQDVCVFDQFENHQMSN